MYSERSLHIDTKTTKDIIVLTETRSDIKLIKAVKTSYNEYWVIVGGEDSVLSSIGVLNTAKERKPDIAKPSNEQRNELIRLGVLYKGMNAASATHYLKNFNK